MRQDINDLNSKVNQLGVSSEGKESDIKGLEKRLKDYMETEKKKSDLKAKVQKDITEKIYKSAKSSAEGHVGKIISFLNDFRNTSTGSNEGVLSGPKVEDFISACEKIRHANVDKAKNNEAKSFLKGVKDEIAKDHETKPSDALYFARVLECHSDLTDIAAGLKMVHERMDGHRNVVAQNQRDIEVRQAIMDDMDFVEHLEKEMDTNRDEVATLEEERQLIVREMQEYQDELNDFDNKYFN